MSIKNAVLVLNQSFEPIQTISIEDAFINYFNGKCYIEEYQENVYHSAKDEWQIPSVIRLKHYVPISKRKRASATKRSRIYIRDGFKCGYCGKLGKERDLTLDHIIPRSKKKDYSEEVINSPENLVTCCFDCNQKKRDKLLSECGMILRHPPKHFETKLDKVVSKHWAKERPSWAKYLWLGNETEDNRYSHYE